MDSFHDMVIVIDPTTWGRQRLWSAMRLAKAHGAYVVGFYAAATAGVIEDAAPLPGQDSPTANPVLLQAGEAADRLAFAFEEALRIDQLDGEWILGQEPLFDNLIGRVRQADLVVVGLGDPQGGLPDPQRLDMGDLALQAGRPVLGMPIAHIPAKVGHQVLVAWSGSRECSRAVNDAMPLLQRAERVTVLAIAEDDELPPSTEGIVAHLRRHGAEAVARHVRKAGTSVEDALLTEIESLRIDLVVAGAWGHSRVSEMLFGGVSRTLLHQMMVPVLLSH